MALHAISIQKSRTYIMFSPKRLSASLDDMRRKAIAKRISRDLRANVLEPKTDLQGNPHNLIDMLPAPTNITNGKLAPFKITGTSGFKPGTPIHHFKEEYILIPEQDMSFATDKQCKELDIYNESLYKKSYKLYQEITAKLAGSNLELKQAPQPPPNPNNLHRLVQYRQRNRDTNCLKQTAALCYLLSLGYQLSVYNTYEQTTTTDDTIKYFEPYQAIELANNLAASRHENYLDASQHLFAHLIIKSYQSGEMATAPPLTRPPSFNQEYYAPSSCTQRPVSATVSVSSFQNYPTTYQSHLYPQIEPDVMLGSENSCNNTPKLPSYPMPDRRSTAPAKLLPIGLDVQTRSIECHTPEHHSVPEKIKYFDEPHNTA